MTENELAEGLREWASGNRGLEVAIELLIAHRAWLLRGTTRPLGTGIGPSEGTKLFYRPIDDPGTAILDWGEARGLIRNTSTVGTPQDRQVLALAVYLAGESKFSLRYFLGGLDGANLALANEAITNHAGATQAMTEYDEFIAAHSVMAKNSTSPDDAATTPKPTHTL